MARLGARQGFNLTSPPWPRDDTSGRSVELRWQSLLPFAMGKTGGWDFCLLLFFLTLVDNPLSLSLSWYHVPAMRWALAHVVALFRHTTTRHTVTSARFAESNQKN